jgi:Zn-finger nucleic acid-binding protein
VKCPACGAALESVDTDGVRMDVCRACSCMLVPQRLISRLLEKASDRIGDKVDPQARIAPLAEIAEHPRCPACDRPMTRDDYCGAGLVTFSRCDHCELLWLHAEQLAIMSVMWARMDGRLEALREADRQALADVNSYVDGVLLGRALSDLLFLRMSGSSFF